MITDHTVRCFYCKGGEFAHNRVTGECRAFERAAVKPWSLFLRRVPAAAAGWRVRPA